MSALEMPKKKPMSRERLIGNDAWFGCSYLGAAARDRIATAASWEMGCTPDSRFAMVRRLTPRRAASPACVRPSSSRCSLYCLEVMLSTGESQLGTSAGVLDTADDFSASLAGSGTG